MNKNLFLVMTCAVVFFSNSLAFSAPKSRKPANSQGVFVQSCDSKTPKDLSSVTEMASYLSGNVRVFHVDAGEPALMSNHLLVYVVTDSATKCFHVSASKDGAGFYDVKLASAKATAVSATELNLDIPFTVNTVVDGDVKQVPQSVEFAIDQAKGTISSK